MHPTKETENSNSGYMPKPLSLRQNLILTVKVLAGAAILFGLVWLAKSLGGVRP